MKKRFILGIILCALAAVAYAEEYDYETTASAGGKVISVKTGSDSFLLTAVPTDGWTFVEWNDGEKDNPRSVSATDATEYEAIFEDNRNGTYTQKYNNPAAGGGVSAAAGECPGDFVLTATPPSGYAFVGWSDGNTDNPRNISVDVSIPQNTFSATFERPQYDVLVSGEGGRVAVMWDESTCELKLIASPTAGWEFIQWNDGNTSNPRVLTSAEETYTATFEEHVCASFVPKYNNPLVGGSVSAEAGECECDWELTATPDVGYVFVGWGDGSTDNPRSVTIDPSRHQNIFEAHFERAEYTVLYSDGDAGVIKMAWNEAECQRNLTAIPADGWVFEQWNDGSTDNPHVITAMGELDTYEATFEDNRCALYVTKYNNPGYGGSISVENGTCDCDRVLTAIPSNGYLFVAWNDGSTENPRTVTIDPSKNQIHYSAVFEIPVYELTTIIVNGEGGKVTEWWDENNCQLTINALPANEWVFEQWSDGSTDNPLILDGDVQTTYTATFSFSPCRYYQASYDNPVAGGTIETEQGICDCDRVLTAVPENGYAFVRWEDGSTINPRNVTIDPDEPKYSYAATFAPKDATIDAWTNDKLILRTKTRDMGATSATVLTNGTSRGTGLALTSVDAGYWSIPASLNAYVGESLRIVFYDECSQPVCVIDTVVPYISTANANLSDLSVPTNADLQVLGGTLTVDADAEIAALDIYPGAKAVVPSGKELTVSSIYMRGNGISNSYPQLVANGNIINANGDSIYYDYTLDYSLYYPLAVPYDVSCNTIRTRTGKRASFEVQWYDGEERAWNGTGWKVFDDQAVGATLRAGTGYIVYAVPYKWNGTRQKTAVVRFPMHADLSSGEEEKSTTVGVYSFDEMTLPSNKNWNFIGNPYLADYTPSGNSRLMVGYYTPEISTATNFDYIYHEDEVRYLTHSDDGFKTYTQARAQDMTMRSFNPYFLQAATAGELEFTISQRAQNASRRMADAEQLTVDEDLAYGVVLTATNALDRTGMLYGEDFTDDYEMNADLVKMFGSNQGLSVYTLAGGEERAFNALSLSNILHPVPVGFRNAPVGEMVFTFDNEHYDASLFDAVMLTDYEAGRVVNLLDEDYRFTTSQTSNDSRFALHAVLAPRNTTDIDYTGGAGIRSAEDGIYDLLGRRVSLDMLPQGVYIIIKNGQCRKEVKR